MLGSKKNGRQELFKKAMLSRGKRTAPRRTLTEEGGTSHFWPAFFLWSAFVIVSGYMLFFSPGLSVSLISVSGESILPLDEYEQYVHRSIQGSYLGFIPKNNFFLIPTKSIEQELSRQYPKISHVLVERQFPIGIRVMVEETPLLFRWCSGGPCYGFMDREMRLLPTVEDPRYEPAQLSIIDESALPVTVGTSVDVAAYFEALDFFYREALQYAGTTVRREARTPSRHSRELSLETDEGWLIQLSTERSPEASLRALQIFLDDYAKEHPDRTRLSHVDLRVEGKIFFSDRSEATLPIESEEGDTNK